MVNIGAVFYSTIFLPSYKIIRRHNTQENNLQLLAIPLFKNKHKQDFLSN
jgi:hypothetical protein